MLEHSIEYQLGVAKKLDEYEHISEQNRLKFIRGLIESTGILYKTQTGLSLTLKLPNTFTGKFTGRFVTDISTMFGAMLIDERTIVITNDNLLDMFGTLYKNIDLEYEATIVPFVATFKETIFNNLKVTFIKAKDTPEAVIPTKAHLSDSGYDLTIVKKVKDYSSSTAMYDTGIIVRPPFGYYCEVVGRSSISKTGYMLSNNIGIIDSSYTGTIKVVLTKVDKELPNITLPYKIAQLIVKPMIMCQAKVSGTFDGTLRGSGGFGSTDEK